jgi:hypothetical protein
MPTFTGMVHEFLEPMPISFADIEADRLIIRHGSWIYEATSRDGFYYEGHYGQRQSDRDRVFRCWLYPGPDGSKMVYFYWHYRKDVRTQGESVFRLVPANRQSASACELPEEWDLVRQALDTKTLPSLGARLNLLLVHDRLTDYRAHEPALNQAGLYVLFYGSGKIARIGQAGRRSLAERLADYESNVDGWFSFRWVGVIPVRDDQKDIITSLEDHLLATFKPPENTRGI